MKKISKKLLIILAALAMAFSAAAFSACGYYSADGLEGEYGGEVTSQGGWVVQKGNYVYFINGMETLATDEEGNATETYQNEYGDVTRGALMRIAVSDLDAGNYTAAETVVPLLMVADDYTAGIFIYGDYVYYATPTTARNLQGETESNYVDFKRSRLDGTETMKDYYFRSDDAAAEYRFVAVNDTVYCLHMDGEDLWSYNTAEREDTLLAKNTASHAFNRSDVSDPYVYYTMNVTEDIDKTNSAVEDYTQVYRVRADASYTLDRDEGSYTVTDGTDTYEYTYDFDVDSLERIAASASDSEDDETANFNAREIDTYPYVNLGQLVLDGIGSKDEFSQYNHSSSVPQTPDGYTYTLLSYDNGGLYYRRSYVGGTSSTGEDGWTFYIGADNFVSGWDAVAGNADTSPDAEDWGGSNDVIALTTNNVSSSTLFYRKDGTHYYLYSSGSTIVRAEVQPDGTAEEVTIAKGVSASSFLFLDNDSSTTYYKYVWYLTSSDTGVGLGRAVYDSTENGYAGNEERYYNTLLNEYKAYRPTSVLGINHPSDWYAPEIIGDRVFFIDTTSVGSFTMNTAQVTSLRSKGPEGGMMDNAELQAYSEKLEDVNEALADASAYSANAGNAVYYYYYTGDSQALWDVIQEYIDEDEESYGQYSVFSAKEQNYYRAYVERKEYTDGKLTVDFSTLLFEKDEDGNPVENGDYYGLRSYFYNTIGVLSEDEQEELTDAWRSNYLSALVDTGDDGLPAWAWALIGIAIGVGVIGVACAVAVPLLLRRRKRAAAASEGVRRKKYKVDMTDDESIDVYADDAGNQAEAATPAAGEVPDESETLVAGDADESEVPDEGEAPAEGEDPAPEPAEGDGEGTDKKEE